MPNPTNETFEEEQQRNAKQGNQSREANQQQDIENPREQEHTDDLPEDTEELSTADEGDDADLAGGEEDVADDDIERSANESGVGGDDLDAGNQRDAGAKPGDGRRQADDVDIERDTRKDDDVEEE